MAKKKQTRKLKRMARTQRSFTLPVWIVPCVLVLLAGGLAVWFWRPQPQVYVPEVDDLFAKVVAAGATVLAEPADKPWGDRTCGFIDPQGQHWYFHRAPA